MALALAGWLVGVPLGYALDRLLVWLVKEVVHRRPASSVRVFPDAGSELSGESAAVRVKVHGPITTWHPQADVNVPPDVTHGARP